MNKEKMKNVMLLVLTIGLVSMTIAYASFTSQLLIKNNNIIIGNDTWDIHFENGKAVKPYGSAVVLSEPELTSTLISGLSARLNLPGDYVEYNFDIKNGGTLDAVLGSIVYTTPSCSSRITDEAITVCNNIDYKVINRNTNTEFQAGDELDKGESVPATLRITYSSNASIELTNQVLVNDFSVLFTYYQK